MFSLFPELPSPSSSKRGRACSLTSSPDLSAAVEPKLVLDVSGAPFLVETSPEEAASLQRRGETATIRFQHSHKVCNQQSGDTATNEVEREK